MNYLIIDLANLFFRARHGAHRQADTWDKIGFAQHVILSSINKCWKEQNGQHVIFCLEGKSWRKKFYAPYKKNRDKLKQARTETEEEEDELFFAALNDIQAFFADRTNCTVLQHAELEADDLIAGWIQSHPDDRHTIISTDSDFYQLLAPNVKQYNGVTDELHTITGIFDRKGRPVIDKKTKEPKVTPDPEWLLFEKCMRGDTADNVFSAYPGVRKKGTKKKVGLLEAFADRNKQGFDWNNMMLQKWIDHNEKEHRVLDDYNRNKILIDLTAQPADIKGKIVDTILKNSVPLHRTMIGGHFLKFCGKYDLVKLSNQATAMGVWLSASLHKEIQ